MTGLAELLADDPQARRLDELEANIAAAERAYRADPTLAADLESSGWFPERTQAAREGQAIWSEGRRQGEPTLKFAPGPGQLQLRLSAWAGFQGLRDEARTQRATLIDQRRAQLLQAAADREAALRERVLDTRVRDLAPLVAEANSLLALAAQLRGPVPRTIRTASGLAPARYPEAVDTLELIEAAISDWSLLEPLATDEPATVLTASYGVQRDRSPSPAVDQVRHDHAAAAVRYGTHRTG
jgi:hypothetical protein